MKRVQTSSAKKKVAKKGAPTLKKTAASQRRKEKVSRQKASMQQSKARLDGKLGLPSDLLLKMHDLMVKSRVLEERLIKVYKTGDAYFWIGGPGEEAFGVPLGLLVNKGHGINHDYLHLHYRATPTLVTMGMSMLDSLRLMMNRATDPSTGGRNFSNHYCFPQWNVVPVGSPIEVQYAMAIGTAISQKRNKSDGITIVTGGDAGTAEGEFASSLIWATRPGAELPMLITVQNNRWGISTAYDTQHGEKHIADRGKAFGMRTHVVNGNDPVETYKALSSEMEHIRKTGKPSLMEFRVSRLYGHSSASGANRDVGECPIESFEKRLVDAKLITSAKCKEIWKGYDEESRIAAEQARSEPAPPADSIWDHTYANNENADWRKF